MTVDATTLGLWRVAESGDVEELAALLPRVANLNARNEHGVTALMRAAQNGHVEMVRTLLEHGADANIKRNDKFTALALAAFFGHTAVVRALLEHGADSQASTRSGTSPQMWATARTFNEVVDELEHPVKRAQPIKGPQAVRRAESITRAEPVKQTEPLAVVVKRAGAVRKDAEPATRTPAAVVRTLKDPPEIWDLVHEAPRGFDPRSAFLARLQSMKSGLTFRVVAAVVLIGTCAAGVLVLRGVQARSERNVESSALAGRAQPKSAQPNAAPPNTAMPNEVSQPAAPAVAPVAESQPATIPEVAPANDDNKPLAARPPSRLRIANSHRPEPRPTRVETNEVVQPIAAAPEKSEPPTRVESAAKPKPKPSAPLSPQLITPAKSSAPKGKVIQWP